MHVSSDTPKLTVHETAALAGQLMHEHGLTQQGWVFQLNRRSKTFLGWCKHSKRVIEVSEFHILHNPAEAVRDTILHEIAHALVGPGHAHDAAWRAACVRIGANPSRCKASVYVPEPNLVAVCPSCGKRYARHRRKRGYFYWCTACGPETGRLDFQKRK